MSSEPTHCPCSRAKPTPQHAQLSFIRKYVAKSFPFPQTGQRRRRPRPDDGLPVALGPLAPVVERSWAATVRTGDGGPPGRPGGSVFSGPSRAGTSALPARFRNPFGQVSPAPASQSSRFVWFRWTKKTGRGRAGDRPNGRLSRAPAGAGCRAIERPGISSAEKNVPSKNASKPLRPKRGSSMRAVPLLPLVDVREPEELAVRPRDEERHRVGVLVAVRTRIAVARRAGVSAELRRPAGSRGSRCSRARRAGFHGPFSRRKRAMDGVQ